MLGLKRLGIFTGGVLFGTLGLKVLASKDAKKVYTTGVAAALRAKDNLMEKATVLQENAEDIVAEAKQMNKERAKKEEEFVWEFDEEECEVKDEAEDCNCEEEAE